MTLIDRKFEVGMWLTGEEAAKFAVASGLTSTEKEFLDEIFIDDNVFYWKAWDSDDVFEGAELIFSGIEGVQFYTLDEVWINKIWTQTEKDAPIIIIPAKNQPNLFRTAYASKEELYGEFQTRFGKYLPKDFDYKSHIGIYDAYER